MSDLVTNSSLDIKQRIDIIQKFMFNSDIQVLSIKKEDDYFYSFKVKYNLSEKTIYIYPKNIVNSGWSNKPMIKRIQVPSFLGRRIPLNERTSFSIFLGIAFVNEKPIFSVWNPHSYVYHKTNRSCYVNVESIDAAFHNGLYKTVDSKKEILLCDEYNFKNLIDLYYEENCQ